MGHTDEFEEYMSSNNFHNARIYDADPLIHLAITLYNTNFMQTTNIPMLFEIKKKSALYYKVNKHYFLVSEECINIYENDGIFTQAVISLKIDSVIEYQLENVSYIKTNEEHRFYTNDYYLSERTSIRFYNKLMKKYFKIESKKDGCFEGNYSVMCQAFSLMLLLFMAVFVQPFFFIIFCLVIVYSGNRRFKRRNYYYTLAEALDTDGLILLYPHLNENGFYSLTKYEMSRAKSFDKEYNGTHDESLEYAKFHTKTHYLVYGLQLVVDNVVNKDINNLTHKSNQNV